MAFVKVRSVSGKILEVPESVYKTQYEGKGYVLVDGSAKNTATTKKPVKEKNTEVEEVEKEVVMNQENDVETIPLAEMNGRQVKEFAKLKGIDVSSAKSTREAKEIIRREMNK